MTTQFSPAYIETFLTRALSHRDSNARPELLRDDITIFAAIVREQQSKIAELGVVADRAEDERKRAKQAAEDLKRSGSHGLAVAPQQFAERLAYVLGGDAVTRP